MTCPGDDETLLIWFLSAIDLRELDAVLSQSLSGITKRIEELTERIEGGLASLESINNAASTTEGSCTSASINL